jgi:hypothetical protein
MSWIKDNPFVATLGGITAVVTGALVFVGSHASTTYETHLASYQENGGSVTEAAKGPLYPNADHSRGKRKALADYRETLLKLQESFSAYRPAELKKLSGQDFTGNLKAADAQVREALHVRLAIRAGQGGHALVHLDAHHNAALAQVVREGRAIRALVEQRLLEHTDARDGALNALRGEEQLAVGAAVLLSVLHA